MQLFKVVAYEPLPNPSVCVPTGRITVLLTIVQLFAKPDQVPPPSAAAYGSPDVLMAELPVTMQLFNVQIIAPPPQAPVLPASMQLLRVQLIAPPPPRFATLARIAQLLSVLYATPPPSYELLARLLEIVQLLSVQEA